MRDLLPIYQAIEFIEAHLQDKVTVSDMACAAGYSLYHFIRAFDQAVWHTPYDYLMRRRLSEAAHALIASGRRVLDIAVDYQFNNHETFSRAFKRMFGAQPVQWRERGIIPRCALLPAISLAYLEHIQAPGFKRPQRVMMPPRCLAGLMTALTGRPEAAAQLWRALKRVKFSPMPELKAPGFFGVTSYLDEQGEQAYYLAAREIDTVENAGPGLACQVLPGGEYICTAHQGPLAALPFTQAFLYHTWLPKAGLQPACSIEIAAFGAVPPGANPLSQVELWLPVTGAYQGRARARQPIESHL
jgi:AraC family transcriptional regulator